MVEGTADSATRHDIALPQGYEEDNWKNIEHNSTLLSVGMRFEIISRNYITFYR